MKKLLTLIKPIHIATLSLLVISLFVRYYLLISSNQLVKEFKNQNYRELFSSDTIKITSRLNSLSNAINWVCIVGTVDNKVFYKREKGLCKSTVFQHQQILQIPQANNLTIRFIIKLPKEVEDLFILFFILQIILISTLIYSTKQEDEKKRQVEINISKLARRMSHDIRSPLATLNSIVSDMTNIDIDSKRLLKNALIRINEISNQLLTDSQAHSVTISLPKLEEININVKIKNLIELKKIEFKNENIKFEIHEKAYNCIVTIDFVEFERIISNLINNAIEANAKQIEITISRNTSIQILIKDNGKGISSKILQELGSKEITTKLKGNGLGIIHAKESVESWHGTINIHSKINEFTEISILLPAFDSSDSTNLSLNILLDDDELVRLTWEFKAKNKKINFKSFKNFNELESAIESIPLNSQIYIDSELEDELKGEEVAKALNQRGFTNLFIASGSNSEQFIHLTFLKGIRDKSPPW